MILHVFRKEGYEILTNYALLPYSLFSNALDMILHD